MLSSSSTITMSGWSSCIRYSLQCVMRCRGPPRDEVDASVGVALERDRAAMCRDDRPCECQSPSVDAGGFVPQAEVRDRHLDRVIRLADGDLHRLLRTLA